MCSSSSPELIIFDHTKYGMIPVIQNKDAEDVIAEAFDVSSKGKRVAIISPANSLGFMDGGIELVYMLGMKGVQKIVYNGIKLLDRPTLLKRPHLPVGMCMAFQPYGSKNENFWFISCPTMFLPGSVKKTNNAMWAMRAASCMVRFLKCDRVYTSLMCAGYGKMSPEQSVQQMMQGWEAAAAVSDDIDYQIFNSPHGKFIYCEPMRDEQSLLKQIANEQPRDYGLTEFVDREGEEEEGAKSKVVPPSVL